MLHQMEESAAHTKKFSSPPLKLPMVTGYFPLKSLSYFSSPNNYLPGQQVGPGM